MTIIEDMRSFFANVLLPKTRTISERANAPGIDVTCVRMRQLELSPESEPFPVKRLQALQFCYALARRLHGNRLSVESGLPGDKLPFFSLSQRLAVFKSTQ
jgi:hypothetical protein